MALNVLKPATMKLKAMIRSTKLMFGNALVVATAPTKAPKMAIGIYSGTTNSKREVKDGMGNQQL